MSKKAVGAEESGRTSATDEESGRHGYHCCPLEQAEILLVEVEAAKNKGNVEFHKGRALAGHTAGKNALLDACIFYSEGIQAMAKADACLSRHKQRGDGDKLSSPPSSTSVSGEDTVRATALFRKAGTLRPSLYLNLAACNLLLQEWPAAIACCTQVLEHCGEHIVRVAAAAESGASVAWCDEESTCSASVGDGEPHTSSLSRDIVAKALYRRSSARVGEGSLAGAKEDLVRALRLKPKDISIRREFRKVQKRLADDEAKEKLRRETEEGRSRLRKGEALQGQQGQQNACEDGPLSAQDHWSSESKRDRGDSPRTDRLVPSQDRQVIGRAEPTATIVQSNSEGSQLEEKRLGAKEEERKEAGDEPFSSKNGGECRGGLYAWSQSVREVHVCVRVPQWVRASDIQVDIRHTRLALFVRHTCRTASGEADHSASSTGDQHRASKAAHGDTSEAESARRLVLSGALSRPVQVDECLWTLERPGRVFLYLQKELPPESEPGSEWWSHVMEGDPKIDVSNCDAGSDVSQYPDHARRRGAKALWEHQRKSPEQRRQEEEKEDQMRKARRQMEQEVEERERNLEQALKDPKKAALYRQLREVMPDIPISMK